MSIQYISDKHRKHTGALISIDEIKIMAQHQNLKALERFKAKPSDYRGTIKKKQQMTCLFTRTS